jgi:hypothetical protein
MPDFSPNQNIELPNATDNANGPLAFDAYNDDVENRLVQRYLSSGDRTVRNPTPNQGELSYVADRDEYQRYNTLWTPVRGADRTARAVLARTTSTSISNSADFTIFSHIINWESATLNDYVTTMWNIANPDRVVLPEAGLYFFNTSVTFSSNGTGQRALFTEGTGTTNISGGRVVLPATSATGGATTSINVAGMVYTTTTTSYIRIYAAQNSGGSLTLTGQTISIGRIG